MLYLWLISFYLWQNWCTIIAHRESQVLPPDKNLFFIIDTWRSGHHLYSTHINSVWPNDAIWLHCSGSTLAQVMAWWLTALSHYLNQCWLIIKVFPWHSPENNFTRRADELILLHICVKKRDIPWGSFLHYQLSHYSDITWTSFHLNSPATELIVQQLVQANKKNQSSALLALCKGNPLVTNGFPSQWTSNFGNYSDIMLPSSWGEWNRQVVWTVLILHRDPVCNA